MNFKKSFRELENPKVWLHYALGTVLIIMSIYFLMQLGYLTSTTSLPVWCVVFFVLYVFLDRVSHGVLELF
jgi:hypothetical protein